MCNLVSSDDDGEHKQTFSIAVIHQYLQMTSIVSPPRGVIQAVLQPLSQPYTQRWKSIIFHKITNDGVLLLCCISQVEFNHQLCVFHYTLAITLFLLAVLTVSLACVKLLGKSLWGTYSLERVFRDVRNCDSFIGMKVRKASLLQEGHLFEFTDLLLVERESE